MRILSVSPRCPAPPDTGGRKVVYHHLTALKEAGHSIGLFTAVPGDKPDPLQEEYLSGFDEIYYVNRVGSGRLKSIARSMISTQSYLVNRYSVGDFRSRFVESLKNFVPDVVQFEVLDLTRLIPVVRQHSDALISYRAHNVQHIQLRRMSHQHGPLSLRRAMFLWEAYKAKRLERWVLDEVDATMTLTDTDADVFRTLAYDAVVRSIPPGSPEEEVLPPSKSPIPTVVFLGTLSWKGNLPGVKWLVREVWPIVSSKTKARLVLAGQNPPEWLKREVDETIEVPGYVEDLSALMCPDHIFVSPLKTGSGIRMKILHALSMGMPVVATPMAVEGLGLRDGREILVRDTAEGFAGAILRLIDAPNHAQSISHRGRVWVRDEYVWKRSAARTAQLYDELVHDEATQRSLRSPNKGS